MFISIYFCCKHAFFCIQRYFWQLWIISRLPEELARPRRCPKCSTQQTCTRCPVVSFSCVRSVIVEFALNHNLTGYIKTAQGNQKTDRLLKRPFWGNLILKCTDIRTFEDFSVGCDRQATFWSPKECVAMAMRVRRGKTGAWRARPRQCPKSSPEEGAREAPEGLARNSARRNRLRGPLQNVRWSASPVLGVWPGVCIAFPRISSGTWTLYTEMSQEKTR